MADVLADEEEEEEGEKAFLRKKTTEASIKSETDFKAHEAEEAEKEEEEEEETASGEDDNQNTPGCLNRICNMKRDEIVTILSGDN